MVDLTALKAAAQAAIDAGQWHEEISPVDILDLIAEVERLREALERARQDINWMLNNRQFLNGHCFDYIASALAGDRHD